MKSIISKLCHPWLREAWLAVIRPKAQLASGCRLCSVTPFWMIIGAVAVAALGAITTAGAANRYVRAGATGLGNGSDWNNAYPDLPATLVRGDTYYVADGNYGSPTFDDNASGTNWIVIKKATLDDHGTETGWQSSYGAGIAAFRAISFARPPSGNGGYYEMNGYSPHVPRNCGFKITTTWHETAIQYGWWDSGNHPYCAWKYIEMEGPGGSGDYDSGSSPWLYGIYAHGNSSQFDTSHMLVSHCYIHGITTLFQDLMGNNYMTVEYSELADSREIGVDHGNIYWVGSSYGTFRYNKVYNYNVEGLYFGNGTTDWQIYGNMFYDGVGVARGIEFRVRQVGTKIYNNTFVNLPLPAVRVMADAGACQDVEVRNNLMVSSGGISLENGGVGVTAANNLTTNTSVFVNYAARDFRLALPVPGVSLPANFNQQDRDGKIRGGDGVWDIGAYEFGGGLPTTNAMLQVYPLAVDFGTLLAGASKTNAITVQNIGGGTLTGTVSISGSGAGSYAILSGGSYNLTAGQSQVITIRYTASGGSSSTAQVVCTGGGGGQVNVIGAVLPVLSGLTFSASAGVISAPFAASNGYLSQPSDAQGMTDGGQAVYGFNLPNAGSYVISANVNAPSTAANSFFVNIDAQPTDPTMIWDVPVSTAGFTNQLVSWRGNGTDLNNQFVPAVFDLPAGNHQLIIRGREAGVQLGQITIMPFTGNRPTAPSALRVIAANP